MIRLILLFLVAAAFAACSPVSKSSFRKTFREIETKFQDHTGFALYDLGKGKTVFEHNAEKYFTPASNTKIFTLFASLKIIGDSVPALHYFENEDSVIVWGTGDPAFLNKKVHHNPKIYEFLASRKQPLYFSNANFHTSNLGSGWSWDDYNDYYSAERSPFPVYGNIFSLNLIGDSLHVSPPYFRKFYAKGEVEERTRITREIHSNDFTYNPGITRPRSLEWDRSMRIDQQLITEMLGDTLKKFVTPVNIPLRENVKTLYSIHVDSLYSEMMQESDNFIAEHLLLICSDIISDTLQTEIAIDYVKENFLKDLPDEPEWVDGSGLSRYNLFTPRSIVKLWIKINEIVPRERLFPLLTIGGVQGTIKNWYKADKPFVFGKTGTLSNVHTLSGFLVTKSGKTLVFSFMNNNYVTSTNDIRRQMQEVLLNIYENY